MKNAHFRNFRSYFENFGASKSGNDLEKVHLKYPHFGVQNSYWYNTVGLNGAKKKHKNSLPRRLYNNILRASKNLAFDHLNPVPFSKREGKLEF